MESIAKAKYEGYLWWSDSREPEVLDGSKDYECSFDASQNPFVIEGNLWDATTNESVYIRYVDGQYIVRRIVVSAEELQGISENFSEEVKKRYDSVMDVYDDLDDDEKLLIELEN